MGTATFHLECIRGGLAALRMDCAEGKLPGQSICRGCMVQVTVHLDKWCKTWKQEVTRKT